MARLDQNNDGRVAINELLLAVTNALAGPDASLVLAAMDSSQDGAVQEAELVAWMPLSQGGGSNTQHPWQTAATGTLQTNFPWNYAMGYHFTPLSNGQVTALGAFVNGTKAVRLFNRTTGAVLATATVTSANTWSYTPITPVTLQAGQSYTVAVYLDGSGGTWRMGIMPTFPRTSGDIRIDASTYIATSSANPTARPINALTSTMYGQADIEFRP